MFLSPANDFHGRIGDLPSAVDEIQSKDWRVTCSPHHNHQDTPEYEVATQLWFDQHLRKSFEWSKTPATKLTLKTETGVPQLEMFPDAGREVLSVDVFYTQHGKVPETRFDNTDVKTRFWHHAKAEANGETWTAALPLESTERPLWVYANLTYALEQPVVGAGYYYGVYSAETYNVSTLLQKVSAEDVAKSGVQATLKASSVIERFEGDWRKQWFSYRPQEWSMSTHKLRSPVWEAPVGASLSFRVRTDEANTLVVRIDDHVAVVELTAAESADGDWQSVSLTAVDFVNFDEKPLQSWDGVRTLKLSHSEELRASPGKQGRRRVGSVWKGAAPEFRDLQWKI